MKTILIQVGKTVNKHFIAGINDYAERISHYMPFDIVTIPELKNTKSLSEEQQKQAEGELILILLYYWMNTDATIGASSLHVGWNKSSKTHVALSSSSEALTVSLLMSMPVPTNNCHYR